MVSLKTKALLSNYCLPIRYALPTLHVLDNHLLHSKFFWYPITIATGFAPPSLSH